MKLLPLAVVVALQVTISISQRTEGRQPILQTLKDHDSRTRAGHESGSPAFVKTNMFIRQMEAVDDEMNFAEVQLTFRMQWNDSRLSHNGRETEFFSLDNPNTIWTPDVFFSNSKSGYINHLLKPNVLLRIYPSGEVLYSSRITVQLKCEPEPEKYPFDRVLCPIVFASYGLTTYDEVLQWKERDPVQISKSVLSDTCISEFRLTSFKTDTCTARTITGEYSCLKVYLELERKPFRTYFFYLYLPSLGLVILSWLTFFISKKASSIVRLTLTLTFALLMVLICTSLWHIRPHYSLIKPSDIWVFVSAIFVFYAMLHYVVTRFVPCCARLVGPTASEDEFGEKSNESSAPILKEQGRQSELNSKKLRRLFENNKADMIARLLYPVAYVIFVIAYSATYV